MNRSLARVVAGMLTIPPAIRRALWARDGGCRFPGCTHHRLVQEGGFDCVKSDAGEIYFVDRDRSFE